MDADSMDWDTNPTFTIIIPTHNRANLLPRAVRSALQQTRSDFEVLIIDDCSSDNTPEVAAGFSDPRIRYIRSEASIGPAAGRNLAAKHARGALLVFLDDDDELVPNFLERAAPVMADGRYCFALVWRSIVFDGEGHQLPMKSRRLMPTGETRAERREWFYQNRMPGGGGGMIVRKACYQAVGGSDVTFLRMEDTELFIRLIEHGDFTVICEEIYRVHLQGNQTDKFIQMSPKAARGLDGLLTKHGRILEQYPAVRWDYTKRAAQQYYVAGERAKARQFMWQLLRNQPRKLDAWKSFLLYDVVGLLPRSWYLRFVRYLQRRR